MFDNLSERLGGILDRLTRRGALTEADVDAAMREVRRALLEADVALDVARAFAEEVKKRAVGVEVIKSVTPGQMVVKMVHDQLIETLGSTADPIDLNAPAPVAIMMVGLQGSGKTTTTAKVARRLADQMKRKALMASLDTYRPAAQDQLAVLGQQVGVELIKSVTPGQLVVKLVHDQLIETLGAHGEPIDLNAPAPVPIMMVGLQGSGKTTTTAKIAKRLTEQGRRKVLMA